MNALPPTLSTLLMHSVAGGLDTSPTCLAMSRPGSGWLLVPSMPVRGLGEPQWLESNEVVRDSMAPAACNGGAGCGSQGSAYV